MKCNMCNGSGMVVVGSFGPRPCPTCGGSGSVYSETDFDDDTVNAEKSNYYSGAQSHSDSDTDYYPETSRGGSSKLGPVSKAIIALAAGALLSQIWGPLMIFGFFGVYILLTKL